MSYFVDVHNGDNIVNFQDLKKENVGLIIKYSEGVTFKDNLCDYRINKCKKIGLPFGLYHFLRGTSSPEEQAFEFWNKLKDIDYQIIPCLDIENPNPNSGAFMIDGYNPEVLANRFIHKFTEISGNQTMLYYMSQNFCNQFSEEFLFNKRLWIASYYSENSPVNARNGVLVAHQFTDRESRSYIQDGFDHSKLYSEDLFFKSNSSQPQPQPQVNKILDLQRLLNEQHFVDYEGKPLIEDGVFGKRTLSACPTLRKGASGNITRWLQLRLFSPHECDGIFGKNTENEVKNFQKNRGLEIDGIVGKNTWRELCK